MNTNSRRAFLLGAPAVMAAAVMPAEAAPVPVIPEPVPVPTINAQDIDAIVKEAVNAGNSGRNYIFPDILKAMLESVTKKLGHFEEPSP